MSDLINFFAWVTKERRVTLKGDLPGHEFRGNQYDSGGGGSGSGSDEGKSGGDTSNIKTDSDLRQHLEKEFPTMRFVGRDAKFVKNTSDKMKPHRAVVSHPFSGMNIVGYGATKPEAAKNLTENIKRDSDVQKYLSAGNF